MSDQERGSSGPGGPAGGKRRRPQPTIDLTATEIPSADPAGTGVSTAASGESALAAADAQDAGAKASAGAEDTAASAVPPDGPPPQDSPPLAEPQSPTGYTG